MKIKLGNVYVGEDSPTFIIAEISANHAQNYKRAVRLVKLAAKAGADAVKFQAYTADTMTIDSQNKCFQIKHNEWGGQSLYDLYKVANTPWSWFSKLKKVAEDLNMVFFATAFDCTSVDFLESIDVDLHKISSFELIDLPLIEYVAKCAKPMILSCGMASYQEIYDAYKVIKAVNKKIMLLKCVSAYPATPTDMNLKTIVDMKNNFKAIVGLSDHSISSLSSVVAVSLGAKIIEKHFTDDRAIKTFDSFFSLNFNEFKSMVHEIRLVEKSLGKVKYGITQKQKAMARYRRSIFVVDDIKQGELLTMKNIKSIRPSNGLKPKYLESILNKRAKKNIKKGTPLKWSFIDN